MIQNCIFSNYKIEEQFKTIYYETVAELSFSVCSVLANPFWSAPGSSAIADFFDVPV